MNFFFSSVKLVLFLLASNKRKNFIEACKNPQKAQEELKTKILQELSIDYPHSPTSYADYASSSHLVQNKISFFEFTSGSSGIKKRIPYTRGLLKSFQNMFILWVHDVIFFSGIKLNTGKFFMSVSPQIGDSDNDDRKYLSLPLRILLSPFLVSNPNHHKSDSTDDFFFKISRDLISNPKIEVISIWSPTYLLALLEFIEKNQHQLGIRIESWAKLWPNLKLISCWTHAQAEKPSHKIKELFPHVIIQGKGLLLTEAPVTIPWSEAKGHIPLVTETIIEFLDHNEIRALHEVEIGKSYILLTGQKNGYLRYNTEDVVKVTGFYHKVPVLEFIGRYGQQIDLAGEKFSETLLQNLTKDYEGILYIIPDIRHPIPQYVILTELHDITDWDQKLKSIYHYKLARNLNQLKAPRLIKVRNPSEIYLQYCQSKGMNLGDIKERILFSNLSEAEKFLAWIHKALSPSLPQEGE